MSIEEATKKFGEDLAKMRAHPTLNQACPRCQKHRGWDCGCTRVELAEAAVEREADFQRRLPELRKKLAQVIGTSDG